MPTPIVIDAVVADTERPALTAVAAQLRECLRAASGADWDVTVRFRASLADVSADARPTLVVASLLPELEGDAPMPAIAARWQAQLSALPGDPPPPVLLCMVFRHVPDGPEDGTDPRPAVRERIRRLNLLAIDLSHDTGAGVVDMDRAFTNVGARALETDYRLGGAKAAEVAAHTIVAGIFHAGLDDVVPRDVQERAVQFQGALRDIDALLDRRLGAAAPATAGAPTP